MIPWAPATSQRGRGGQSGETGCEETPGKIGAAGELGQCIEGDPDVACGIGGLGAVGGRGEQEGWVKRRRNLVFGPFPRGEEGMRVDRRRMWGGEGVGKQG